MAETVFNSSNLKAVLAAVGEDEELGEALDAVSYEGLGFGMPELPGWKIGIFQIKEDDAYPGETWAWNAATWHFTVEYLDPSLIDWPFYDDPQVEDLIDYDIARFWSHP